MSCVSLIWKRRLIISIGTSSSICLGDVALGIGGVHVLRTVFLLPVSQFWSMETLLLFHNLHGLK